MVCCFQHCCCSVKVIFTHQDGKKLISAYLLTKAGELMVKPKPGSEAALCPSASLASFAFPRMPFKAGCIFWVHCDWLESFPGRETGSLIQSNCFVEYFFLFLFFKYPAHFFQQRLFFHLVDALDVSLRSPPMLLPAVDSAWMTIKPSEPVDRSGPSGSEEVHISRFIQDKCFHKRQT